MPSLQERFWAKGEKTQECWNWTGARTPDGYGKFRVGHSYVRASRFAYQGLVGSLEPDLLLRHTCRNSLCVNPAHLKPVTARELTRLGRSPAGANARKTHCKHGHPLSGDNLYVDRNGYRKCSACRQRFQQERKARFRGRRRRKPGKVVLRMQMERMNLTQLGEHYGVTDTAVRKWAKEYGLR